MSIYLIRVGNERMQIKTRLSIAIAVSLAISGSALSRALGDEPSPGDPAQQSSSVPQGNVAQSSLSEPLQGNVEQKSLSEPLQGGVERRVVPAPPLQGGVEQKFVAPTLQPGVGRFATEPLRGAVDQNGGRPLQGAVQDSQRNALQGRVNDQGAILGARTPSFSAVMRIIQIKNTDAVPLVKPPPITEDEIQKARFRDALDANRIPARAEDDAPTRPIRGQTTDDAAPILKGGRPQRAAPGAPRRAQLGAPRRVELDEAPTRTLLSVDAPPIRTEEGGWLTPPSRLPMIDQPPSSRVELNPAIMSPRNELGANVRPAQQDNSRILPPPNNSDVAVAPQRTNPLGFQEPVRKKKRDKKPKLDVKPDVGQQAVPELAATAAESLLWDRWYQHVNELVCAALRTTMPRHGNPAGTNRVHITVWSDHRIEPRLVESNNSNFDQAILEAYKSLNGSAELEFPKGTHRNRNDYETAHIQEIPAATAAFDSRTVRGDLETLVK